MRKLLFFVEGFTDIRYVIGLSEIAELTMCVPAGAYTSSGLKERVASSGARIQVHEIAGGRLAYQWRSLAWLWRHAREFDAILSQEMLRGSLNATLVGALRGVPVITTLMLAPVEYFRCRRRRRSIGPIAAWAGELAIRTLMTITGALSTRCVALGEYLRGIASRYCARTVSGGYYGVDLSFFTPATPAERIAIRQRLGLRPDAFIVFLASRISHEKDPETVLRATALARARGLDAVLLNLSGGYQEFIDLAERLSLPDASRWVIGRPAAHPMVDVADYFRASDVIAQASLAEGLGLSPLEGLACGIPVVATEVGGMAVTLPGYARLVPPGDAEAMAREFQWVSANPAEARTQALRGREMVQRDWSREKAFADLARVVDDVTTPSAAKPGMTATAGPSTQPGSLAGTSRHIVLLLVLAILVGARLYTGPHVVDDAYITFRYSEHLAALGQFSYNPPAAVLGTTTPLFTLMLAAARVASIPPTAMALVVSVIADCATALMVAVMLAAAGRRAAGLVAAALIAVSPIVITYSVSGMETSLYVALLTTTVLAFSRKSWAGAATATGLACLCRPDGSLVAVVMFVGFARRHWPSAVRYAVVVAAIGLPWAAWSQAHFGSIVPLSVTAKAAHTGSEPFVSLQNFVDYFSHGQYLVFTALATLGAVALVRSRATGWGVWCAWWALYATVFLAANAFTYFPWYFIPLLPLYFAAAACGAVLVVEAAVRLLVRTADQRLAGIATTAATMLLVAAIALGGSTRVAANREYLDSLQQGRERLYASIASTLSGPGDGCVLAATEIGTLGYYYPGPILDLVGLVSPEVIGRDPAEALRGSGAQWLVSYDTHLPAQLATAAWFSRDYRRIQRIPVSSDRALEVYERIDAPCGAARVAGSTRGAR